VAGGVEDLHGKVAREVKLREATTNGEEREGRELDGITVCSNRGGAGASVVEKNLELKGRLS
jgi:hypothetical protein